MIPLVPPMLRPAVPPSRTSEKPLVTYESLIDKPQSLEEAGIGATGDSRIKGPLHLHTKLVPPLTLERDETTAADGTMLYAVKRDKKTFGYFGLNADDHLVFYRKEVPTDDTDDTVTPLVIFADAFSLNVEGAAAVHPLLALMRGGAVMGYLGLDGSDNVAFIGPDGTTTNVFIDASGQLHATAYFDGDNDQVVGHQLGAIADGTATSGSSGGGGGTGGDPSDPATLGDVDGAYGAADAAMGKALDALGTATTALDTVNAILGALRTHGLIAT